MDNSTTSAAEKIQKLAKYAAPSIVRCGREGYSTLMARDVAKPLNRSLHAAKATKQDEFYTQLPDIEKELVHYRKHFKGKTVLCNCDDPRCSKFFEYFLNKFEILGLKRLIATCYQNDQPDVFSQHKSGKGIYFVYSGEQNGTRKPDPKKIKPIDLKGDGDFRSEECVKLLKQADIVVTNPPFSLFREYVTQLINHEKKFVIIGNHNAIIYKEVFRFIKQNMIWLGCTHPVAFVVPNHYEMRAVRSWRTDDGTNWRSLGNACWFTNLDIAKRHEELPLFEKYDPRKFPTYDNYDAIEVTRYKEIPVDYDGVMGVPVTFLEQHNPEQFEIVGCNRGVDQDPKGVYGRGSHLNGKETFKRLFVRRRMESA